MENLRTSEKSTKDFKLIASQPLATTKTCNVCGEEKDLSEFYKRRSSLDGYRKACKICCNRKRRKEKNDYMNIDIREIIKEAAIEVLTKYMEV